MNRKMLQLLFFLAGLIGSIGFDQLTKRLAVLYLKEKPAFSIWDGVFELRYSENRGAAFGVLQGQQSFFFVVAFAVIAFTIWALWRMPSGKRYLPFAGSLFLLVSGAVGNLIDRVANGYVVDFLYFRLIDFPIFNVADCYVVVATFLLIVLFFFYYSDEELAFLSWKGRTGERIR